MAHLKGRRATCVPRLTGDDWWPGGVTALYEGREAGAVVLLKANCHGKLVARLSSFLFSGRTTVASFQQLLGVGRDPIPAQCPLCSSDFQISVFNLTRAVLACLV